MATENLEINIGANTQDLQTGLNAASQSVQNFGNTVRNNTRSTLDATNTLTNFSRIAEDSAYGLRGVANNINPFIESFQRLSRDAKEAGVSVSKALISSLTGPAGITVAIGVVSSILIAFGDDIANFVSKLFDAGAATKEMKTAISGIGGEFTSSVEKVNKVAVAFDLFHKGLITGEAALSVYNTKLGANYGLKKNINEAEATFKEKTADYIQAQLQRALADAASAEAAKKLLEKEKLGLQGPKTSVLDYFGAGFGPQSTATVQKVAANRLKEQQAEIQKEIDGLLGIQKKAEELANTIANTSGININIDVTKQLEADRKKQEAEDKKFNKTKQQIAEDRLKEEISILEAENKATLKWADEQMKIYNRMLDFWKKYGDIVKAETGVSSIREMLAKQDKQREKKDETPFSERKADIKLPVSLQSYIEGVKKFDNDLKQAKDDAEKFAEVIARDVTGAFMSMFDAMQQGENPLQALGDYFTNLAKQIAAAAIQAALFQAILMAFGYGGDSFGTGFFEGFKKILGFAEGGIVSQPTIAMVGEGGQSEAIMPLNKLGNMMNSTFNAGAMSGGGNAGNGQFVLKGQDLILAINRSNASLNLRRGF